MQVVHRASRDSEMQMYKPEQENAQQGETQEIELGGVWCGDVQCGGTDNTQPKVNNKRQSLADEEVVTTTTTTATTDFDDDVDNVDVDRCC
jgi:hypothetical protein